MKRPRISLLLLVSILLVGATLACGDDEQDTSLATSAAATQTQDDESPRATADNSPGATGGLDDEVQVQAADFSFDPASFAVPAGVPVKIEVRNGGAVMHTLTVYSDPEYTTLVDGADTDNIEAGEDASIETTFDAGQYFFRCDIHPSRMQGDLTAE
jgi:plastocyanin